MSYTLQARPTTYKGIRMRSRLEAKVAASLDQYAPEGCWWEYEPECFADENGQYLPDFRMGPQLIFLEVKHVHTTPAEMEVAKRQMEIILSTHRDATLMVVATDGTDMSDFWIREHGSDWTTV